MTLGWVLAAACNLAVVYGLVHYNGNFLTPMPLGLSAFYQTCSRTAWGLGLAWVIFACCRGYGGRWLFERYCGRNHSHIPTKCASKRRCKNILCKHNTQENYKFHVASVQGSHRHWKTWKTWKNETTFSSQGKVREF